MRSKYIQEAGFGCLDGSCIFGSPGGMHTNGGCQCIKDIRKEDIFHARRQMTLMAILIKDLAKKLEYLESIIGKRFENERNEPGNEEGR